jgi:hypothetical protein
LHRCWAKFLRLLTAFAAAVWVMRSSVEWMHTSTGFRVLAGWLVVLVASFALGITVSEEVRRDRLQ